MLRALRTFTALRSRQLPQQGASGLSGSVICVTEEKMASVTEIYVPVEVMLLESLLVNFILKIEYTALSVD